MIEITMTLVQLRILLDKQKEIVIDSLASQSAYYNKESDAGTGITLHQIDKDKFKEIGMKTKYPNDYHVLNKYLKAND